MIVVRYFPRIRLFSIFTKFDPAFDYCASLFSERIREKESEKKGYYVEEVRTGRDNGWTMLDKVCRIDENFCPALSKRTKLDGLGQCWTIDRPQRIMTQNIVKDSNTTATGIITLGLVLELRKGGGQHWN